MSTQLEEGFTRRYIMRRATKEADSVVTTLPKAVIEKAARRRQLSLDEFLAKYQVEYVYNDGEEGFWTRFVVRSEKKQRTAQEIEKLGLKESQKIIAKMLRTSH